ncbi:MAG: MerR family transcriptional regulator [Planctomycetales bacterium]|nr:MerR family transcriptional regulator [Planctomycetales bacterium]
MRNWDKSGQKRTRQEKKAEKHDGFGVPPWPEMSAPLPGEGGSRGQNRPKEDTTGQSRGQHDSASEEAHAAPPGAGGPVVTDEPDAVLPPKQVLALNALLAGMRATDAAAQAGVSVRTLRRWRNEDNLFRTTLNRKLFEARDAGETRLGMLVDASIGTVCKAVLDGNAQIALRLLRGLGYLDGKAPAIGPTCEAELQSREQEISHLSQLFQGLRL